MVGIFVVIIRIIVMAAKSGYSPRWRSAQDKQGFAREVSPATRFRMLSGIVLMLAGVVLIRLFYWQIVRGEELKAVAERQHTLRTEIPAQRGKIMTQSYQPLVGNQPAYTLYADKTLIEKSSSEIALALAPMLVEESTQEADLQVLGNEKVTALRTVLDQSQSVWVRLATAVSDDLKSKIDSLGFKGLIFQEESMRHYPEASMSAQVLGFVGSDSVGMPKGYFGLEGYYDLELTGKPGEISIEKDAAGNPILLGERNTIPGTNGRDLVTHLDKTVQFVLEKKLREGIQKYGALSGTVTVMDPKTGAIMGMTAVPSYDQRMYKHYPKEDYPNPIVASGFEPGSIFKILIMAAGINEGVVSPGTVCSCAGPLNIGTYSISTWNHKYYRNSTMTEVLTHSDNVGMVFVAQKLQKNGMLKYIHDYGFGQTSGVDLQEEASPTLRDDSLWKEIDLAVGSFGQGIAITPLQMVAAAGTIAGDGWLRQPQVVDKIIDNGQVADIAPKKIRQVLKPETVQLMRQMMVQSAKFGEAKWTFLKGYNIAGKTGTAQIPVEGHYDEEKTIASFIGFGPADDPKFVMLVTLREPTSSPWGSETAAPLWYEIARELFLYWGIQPRGE